MEFRRIVSLGALCEAQYQIRRLTNDTSERARYVVGLKSAALGCPSSVFSWQITPLPALFEYFKRDFKGMMELGDLAVRDRVVVNTRFHTQHHHEFKKDLSDEGVAESFPIARRKHDAMCERTRRLVGDDEPTLFALARSRISAEELSELTDLIRFRNPSKRFDFLLVEAADGHDWTGDDGAWNEAFRAFEYSSKLRLAERLLIHALKAKSQLIRLRGHLETGKF
ncbi:MAG TPA: hypothetical protein VGO04_06260 [Ensifer sp.]|jgi:hypothetical protein|uniref:hypothetical protein n=1 Tax=Ensifer sp. TaxID=1872086 RepID=UPI002E0D41F5|nr:hypothetical protein [Ensifer sp.]